MKRNLVWVALITAGLLLWNIVAFSQVTSTFDADADGWTFYHGPTGTYPTVVHNATGGNPGGYVSVTYASQINTSALQYWIAPEKFIGTLVTTSLDKNFKVDIQQSTAGASYPFSIRIYNNTYYISYSFPVKPATAPAWSTYSVALNETGGWTYNSQPATRDQVKFILSNVTSIIINGTYAANAAYISGIDNIVLEEGTLEVAPAISSFGPLKGKPGESLTIDGTNFDPVATNNEVFFGYTRATINSASATQLTVTVPLGATYGPITVINKIKGTSSLSSKPFNPVFDGGGRIVRASFKPRVDFALSNADEGWNAGDIDGDGFVDLAMANNTADYVDIYRNAGAGGAISASLFEPKVTLLLAGNGNNYTGVRFVDLDGDGKQDLVASTSPGAGASFATYRNISTPGNIAFEAQELWAGNSDETPPIFVGDIDGDGRPELGGSEGSACSCGTARAFWIIQNISTPGDIQFGNSTSLNLTMDGVAGASFVDLDDDNKPEIIISEFFGQWFTIVKNNSTPGRISLTEVGSITTGQYNSSVQGGDFNLDGKTDLIWKKSTGIYIRINTDTDGILTTTDFDTEVAFGSDVAAGGGLVLADINGDARPDIVTGDNDAIGVYENVYTGGTFDTKAFVPAYQVAGAGDSGVIVADLNKDGKVDILSCWGGSSFSVFENQNVHMGAISMNTVFPLKGEIGSTVTITGNNFSTIPADNHVWFGAVEANVLTATPTQLTAEVPAGATYSLVSVTKDGFTSRYHLPFTPTFGPGVTFDNTHFAPPVNFTLTGADYDIDISDLDLDGKPDIVAEGGGFTSYFFRNTHTTGAITTSSLAADGFAANFFNPKLMDVDGDGYKDILTGSGRLAKNNSTTGDISFQPEVNLGVSGDNIAYGDFNLDGKTDGAITSPNAGTNNLFVIENRSVPGNFTTSGAFGTFSDEFFFGRGGRSGSVVTGDFDKDGFIDVIATTYTSDQLSIYHNEGELKISATQFLRTDVVINDAPYYIYTGDFDVDGRMDLLVCNYLGTSPGIISVFHNQSTPGTITFNRFDINLAAATVSAVIADIDGDGLPDIAVASEAANRFSILKNIHTTGALTAASFATPFNTTVTTPRGINAADLNFDGKPEIIISGAGLLRVFENLIPTGPAITIDTQPIFTYACEGETATFNIEASGTTNLTYKWQKYDGSSFVDINDGSGYSGTATKTLSINTATTGFNGNGQYRCRVNGDLAAEVITGDAQLTINSLPSPPDVTAGTECVSPSTVILTASGTSDGSYRWYDVAAGGSVLGMNGSFTTPPIASTKTFYVSIRDSFCESTRVPVDATITLLNKPSVGSNEPIVSGGIDICNGEDCTLTAPTGFVTYTWSNGDTGEAITVDQSGSYTVIVEDSNGCTSPASDPVTVTVNPFPTAIIDVNGTQLSVSPGDNYQWYLNGDVIAGATSQTYQFSVLEFGVYVVDVTDNGCTTISDEFTYLITGEELGSHGLKIYPNPFSSSITIESSSPETTVSIIDAVGRMVRTRNKVTTAPIDVSDLSEGQYMLMVTQGSKKLYFRLIKAD